jgi:endonuclease III
MTPNITSLKQKQDYLIDIFRKAEKRFGSDLTRLSAEGWDQDWKVLIATIMSAQSRDETTIPITEKLFSCYPTINKLADAKYNEVLKIFGSLNYNRSKSLHVIEAAKYLKANGLPDTIDELIKIPGVGRKTANLILTEVHHKPGICVDTHVHRISNVLGFVKTKTPEQTEYELKKIAPQEIWPKINRIFVLWGKNVPGRDKNKLLEEIN